MSDDPVGPAAAAEVYLAPVERATYEQIGKQIRESRSALGMTQNELAAYLGLTRSSVANIEAGRQAISAYTLLRVHGLMGLAFPGLVPDPDKRRAVSASRRLVDENAKLRQRIARVRNFLNGNDPERGISEAPDES